MIISDLNHLETVANKKVVGGLDYVSVNKYSNLTFVNQTAFSTAKNESIYSYYGGGASAYSSNFANVYSF